MPEEKKKGFGIKKTAASVGKDLYSGALRGATEVNKFLGLGAFEPTRKLFIEPAERKAATLEKETEAKTALGKFGSEFTRSLGNLGVSLPVDIMTGGATKAALLPKITSSIANVAKEIPHFAVGMGVRGAVEGYKEGEGMGKIPSALSKGGEAAAKGIVYGKVGASIPKLAAVGVADATYEAAKEGRAPTEEEIVSGAAHNAALGVLFKALPGGHKKKLPIEDSAVKRGLSALEIEAKRLTGKVRSQEGSIEVLPFAERRKNLDLRKKVAEMTPEERAQALLTDHVTGQKNKRAYEEAEAERLPFQASLDVDGLKFVNDTHGHDAGTALLKRVGEALEFASGEGRNYHFHGDEFALEGMSKPELFEISRKAKEYLKENPLELTDKEGNAVRYIPDFSIGVAKTLDAADKAMLMNKKARRVERGAALKTETELSKKIEKDELANEINSEMNTVELEMERSAIAPEAPERPLSVAERFKQEVEKLTGESETASQRVSKLLNSEERAAESPTSQPPSEESRLQPPAETPPASPQKAKEPWEMSKAEFDKSGLLPDDKVLREIEARKPKKPKTKGDLQVLSKYDNAKAVWNKEYKAALKNQHQRLVENALTEGRPVPKEVLTDYPELQKAKEPTGQPFPKYEEQVFESSGHIYRTYHLTPESLKEHFPEIVKEYGATRWLKKINKGEFDLHMRSTDGGKTWEPTGGALTEGSLSKPQAEDKPAPYNQSTLIKAKVGDTVIGQSGQPERITSKTTADIKAKDGRRSAMIKITTELPDGSTASYDFKGKPKPLALKDAVLKAEKDLSQKPKEFAEPIPSTSPPPGQPLQPPIGPPPIKPPVKPPVTPPAGPPRTPVIPPGGSKPPVPPGRVLPASDSAFKLGVERFLQFTANNRFSLEKVQNRLTKMNEGLDLLLREVNRPKRVANQIRRAWEEEFVPFLKKVAVEAKVSLNDAEMYFYAKHAPEVNYHLRRDNAKLNLAKIFKAIGKKEQRAFLKKYVKKGDKATPENMYQLLNLAFHDYAHFKQVQKIKTAWDKFAEKPSGMTDQEAAAVQQRFKNKPALEEARQKLRAIADKTLDIYHDAGIITDKEYKAMKQKYKDYVPLHREGFEEDFRSTGQGIQPAGKPYKTRAGSTRRAADISTHVLANYETAIQRALKAESDTILAKMVNANPDPNVWSIIKVKQSPRRDVYGNIKYYPNVNDVAKHEMRLMIKGKQYLLSVNKDNPTLMRMLDVLKGTADSEMGSFIKVFSKVNRFLARMYTTWGPEFMLGNFPRDLETAMINIRGTGVKSKGMLKGALKSIGAIYKVERGATPKAPLELLYDRLRNAGGKIDWSDSYKDIPDLAKKISREFDMLQGKRIPRKTLRAMGNLIGDMNTAVENGVRLHVFKLATEQGFSDPQAARIASQITVDFTQHGTAGPVINGLWLFANANIGGVYRMATGIIKSKAIRYKIIPSIIGAGFVNALYNNWMGGEDKDGQTYYNKMDDFVKERNMVFMIPGTEGKHVTIPLAYGYGFFWTFGNEMARAISDSVYNPIDGGARMVNSFANSFNPIGSGTLGQTIAPTVFDPMIQIWENKTWFGGDLVPAENPFEKVKTPDSERSWKATNPGLKWLARELNSLTGGNKVRSGLVDISPETFDLWLDTVGGSALSFVKRSFAVPEKLLLKEDLAIREIPIVRRFAGSKSEWADSRTYYDNVIQVLTVKDELEAYNGDPEYNTLNKKYGFMRQLFAPARVAEFQLKQARKLKRSYEAQNIKQLVDIQDRTIQDIYVRFNKQFYEVMERENKRR